MPLSSELRARLAKPFGRVMHEKEVLERLAERRPALLIAVGDQILYNLLEKGCVPEVAVFDLRCQRVDVPLRVRTRITAFTYLGGGAKVVANPAGSISPALEKAAKACLEAGKGWLKVEGEDDLAALALMAYAPDTAVLLYGQPREGAVWVEMSAEKREEAKKLMDEVRAQSPAGMTS